MNTFEINIVGETPLNDEQIGKCLDAIHDYVEYVLRGECGIVYTPTDEQGKTTQKITDERQHRQ